MKPFESFLASRLEEYIDYREALKYNIRSLRSNLRNLDRYVADNVIESEDLTPLFFLSFKENLRGGPSFKNTVLSAARGFFKYQVRAGRHEKNPMRDIPPFKENAYMPFIFSPGQLDQLLRVLQKRIGENKKYFLSNFTKYIAMALYAGCGLRLSEPLRLLVDHYRGKDGTIYIEKTKFNKDRLIPIPKNLIGEINNYLAARARFARDKGNRYLLPGRNGKGITNFGIYKAFHSAAREIGVDQPKRIIGDTTFNSPNIHSFRHSFAINALKRIRDRGGSTQNALPILAAYLGHTKYSYTEVYLKYLDANHRRRLIDLSIYHLEDL